jgi:hypothetical protein
MQREMFSAIERKQLIVRHKMERIFHLQALEKEDRWVGLKKTNKQGVHFDEIIIEINLLANSSSLSS